MRPRIRVVLADDHTLFRQGLRAALTAQAPFDIEIVGEASDGLAAQEVAVNQAADVVLMNVALPIISGLAATRELARMHPNIAVIIVSEHHDEGNVMQGLRAGCRGYFSKSCDIETLIEAIKTVAGGQFMLDTASTGAVISEFRRLAPKAKDGLGGLSHMEMDLLAMLGAGCSNKEIAGQMHIVESTAKNRLTILYAKLGVLDRTQAAIYGIRHGVVPGVSEADSAA